MEKISILGINVNFANKKALIEQIKGFFDSTKTHLIITVNPEIVLKAIKDEEYFYTINHADIGTVDGTGIKIAAWFVGKNPERLTGAELTVELLKYCHIHKKAVAILNWNEGLIKNSEIVTSISKMYPGLSLEVIDIPKTRSINKDLVIKLNDFKPELILNNLGNPEQEIMQSKLKNEIASAKVLVGIGGSLDYLLGKKKSAPIFFKKLGLEWLWRIWGQPIKDLPVKRRTRIYNAFLVFVYEFIKWRFVLPFKYRPNVACLLYKKVNNKYQVLIVERKDEPGHWQIPQGGTGGLSLEEAGEKEIREEIGNEKIKTINTIPNLYKYNFYFTQSERERSSYHRGSVYPKHTGYRGQKQGLWIGEYLGSDEDIDIKYWDHNAWRWVDLDELVESVHECRKEATGKFVEEAIKII